MTHLATTLKVSDKIQASAGQWLTEDDMRRSLPAIFASEAHESRSDRYCYIPTIDIVRGLDREGFRPTFACQAKTRDESMRGHTKHLLRFRRDFSLAKPDVAEIVMVNSHGGQSSAQLFGGWFRFICLNGMVCGETLGEVRVRHSGDVVGEVIEGAYTIVNDMTRVADSVDQMKALRLTAPEQRAFAESAAMIRFDVAQGEPLPVQAEQMLRARRYDDSGDNLWSTFNRVQENALRGGLHGRRVDANGRRRRVTTREVNGIDQNVALNRALWTLAERMAELKA